MNSETVGGRQYSVPFLPEVKSVIPFAFIKFPMFSTAMTLPMQYVYFSLVLMFGFMVIAYLCEVLGIIITWNEKEGK